MTTIRTYYTLFIMALALLMLPPMAKADDNDDLYLSTVEKADEAIAKSDWTSAEKLLLEAIKLKPGNPANAMLISNLGIVRFNAGHDSLALSTLNDAVDLVPTSTTLLKNRAMILSAMNREREAFNDYTKIISLDSTLVEPRFYHAMIAMRNADLATAESDFLAMQRMAPDNRLTNIGLATFYSTTRQHEKAIPFLNKVLETDKEPEYYGARALCYIFTDRLNEASADIADALKADPTYAEIYIYRALLNQRRFRPEDAKRDAQRAIELGANPRYVKSIIVEK